jgi:hypothetical protein
MSLFSFFKSDKPVYADKVWKTRPMAMKGMITEALKAITQNKVPVVFCYFDDTITEVVSFLTTAHVPYFHLTNDTIGEASDQSNVVFVSDASLISSSTGLVGWLHALSLKSKIQFLFAEHYPLPGKEIKMLEKLSSSYPQSAITFCSSMDDPSFEPFGADRIVAILDQLGLKEDECIEHPMVSKAMANAREKIESKVQHEIAAKSEGEWFLRNIKK